MAPTPTGTADITDNDRLIAALAYPLSPLVSIIILLVESMKARPYQRYHGMQSLPFGILQIVLSIISPFTLGISCCVTVALLIVQLYYAYRAYQGAYFEVPVITQFMRGQGWMQ